MTRSKLTPRDLSLPGEAGRCLREVGLAKGRIVVRAECQTDAEYVAEQGPGCALADYADMHGGSPAILRIAAYALEDRNYHEAAEVLFKMADD